MKADAEFLDGAQAQALANPTDAERAMWEILEPLGFMREVWLTGHTKNGGEWLYRADFWNPVVRLIVEVDGSSHRRKRGRDRRRDTRLAGEGIQTCRVTNRQVEKHGPEVRSYILGLMERRRNEQ